MKKRLSLLLLLFCNVNHVGLYGMEWDKVEKFREITIRIVESLVGQSHLGTVCDRHVVLADAKSSAASTAVILLLHKVTLHIRGKENQMEDRVDVGLRAIDRFLFEVSTKYFTQAICDQESKVELLQGGLIFAGVHVVYLSVLKKMRGRVSNVSMYVANGQAAQNNNIRRITGNDACPVCLESFAALKKDRKDIMQAQCCGQIICKQDLLDFIKHWNSRTHQINEKISCPSCSGHPLFVGEVDKDGASILCVGSK